MCQSLVYLTPSHLSPVSLPAPTRWEGPSFLSLCVCVCVCVCPFQLKLNPIIYTSLRLLSLLENWHVTNTLL